MRPVGSASGLKVTAGQRSMTAEIRQMTADDGFPLFTLTIQKKRSSKQKRIIFSNKDFKRYKDLTFLKKLKKKFNIFEKEGVKTRRITCMV